LATDSPKTFERVVGLASTVKAAAIAFLRDEEPKPEFIVLAERYLAEGPEEAPIARPRKSKRAPWPLRTGPVVRRKGSYGRQGRGHQLEELKASLLALIGPLTDDDLRIHLRAHWDPAAVRPKERWVLPLTLADELFSAFARGWLADLLREHDVHWNWEKQRAAVSGSFARYLQDETDLGTQLGAQRAEHLRGLAERMICIALETIGVPVPKDFFRQRRGRPSSSKPANPRT
jgi:hypothetical protein